MSNDENFDLLNYEELSLPPIIHRGVVFLRKDDLSIDYDKPLYIVEYVEDDGLETVTVYDVEKGSAHPPKKKQLSIHLKRDVDKYTGGTLLSALARQLANKQQEAIKSKKEDAPPLFMELVEYGIDTFTGEQGKGFYERGKDMITALDKISVGKNTGVFITLSSILWLENVISLQDIVNNYNINKRIWFGEM